MTNEALTRSFELGGEAGRCALGVDWAATPLGPVSQWPPSLRDVASLVLGHGFAMNIAWGPELIQIYNDATIPIMGRKHPAAMGQSIRETWAEIWDFLEPTFAELFRTGRAKTIRNNRFFIDRRGFLEEMYVDITYSVVRDERGEVGGVLSTSIEVTERVLGERRLRTLRALAGGAVCSGSDGEVIRSAMAALAENPNDISCAAVYALDARHVHLTGVAGTVSESPYFPARIELNEGAFFGSPWPLERVLATGKAELVDALESSPHAALVLPIQQSPQHPPYGVLIVGLSPHLVLDDAYKSFLELVARDIGASLGGVQAFEEVRERARKLAELDRAKTVFLSNISHEFRTPLTLLIGPVDEMLAGPLVSETQRALLEMVRRNATRLLKLVGALLDFARIESGRFVRVYTPTDLSALTRELVSLFESAAAKAGLRVSFDAPDGLEPVYVDRDMWETIVTNLLSNALKFTWKGKIAVSLKLAGDQVELAVRDTGTGITPESLPHVFDRFFRDYEAHARTHEGAGIGLSLVKELAELHGGAIWVESELGQGSTFTVSVPRGKAHLPAELIDERTHEAAVASARRAAAEALGWMPAPEVEATIDTESAATLELVPRPRILVADDNADMRDFLFRLLSNEYDVELVSNGAAALEAVRRSVPDLVLSDVMMPAVDGFRVLRELRSDPRTAMVPLVLLSARAGAEATLEGLAGGADDYVVKPFSARELLARVRTHLELARARREAAESRLKDVFLGVAAHELNTPLTSLKLRIQLVMRQLSEFGTVDAQVLANAQRAIDRMERLVADLVSVAALREKRLLLERTRQDLVAICRRAVEQQTVAPAESVVLDLPSSPVMALVDYHRVLQAVQQLLSNALKFSPPDKKVTLSLREVSRSEAQVCVRDEGPGLDEGQASRLFERFYRAPGIEVQRGSQVGLGLGLYLSKMIVTEHGGRIWADSAPGKGSSFCFTLPIG